jgi:hypothetical protein
MIRYAISENYHIYSGVSQGSILGPLLLLLMVNNLLDILEHATYLLANNLKIILNIDQASDHDGPGIRTKNPWNAEKVVFLYI